MNAEMYRLKPWRGRWEEDTLTHDGREWVVACAWTQYPADAEILIETKKWRKVVLFADLDDFLKTEGVCII